MFHTLDFSSNLLSFRRSGKSPRTSYCYEQLILLPGLTTRVGSCAEVYSGSGECFSDLVCHGRQTRSAPWMGLKRAEKYSLDSFRRIIKKPSLEKLSDISKPKKAGTRPAFSSTHGLEQQTTYVAQQTIHLCKEATCITTINRTVIVRQTEWQH